MKSETVEILDRLVAFPTLSRTLNLDLICYARSLLEEAGARCQIVTSEDGSRANLYATIGPDGVPGVILSGHTDVVPVEGQAWSGDPFRMTHRDGRYYGRGTADMKGFVAAALAAVRRAGVQGAGELATPLHLALSYDEEIGCIGVRSLIDLLAAAPVRPAICIVGEPTGMAVATGHKGKMALRAVCHGREGHSALAPMGLNALHLAAELVGVLRAEQERLQSEGARDGDYDVPYTTVHAGILRGGVQVNIVPNRAELDWEIRHVAEEDPAAILAQVRQGAAQVVAAMADPDAAIEITETNAYPGLDTPPSARAVDFVKGLTGANGTIKVAFGTEGGLFDRDLGVSTVICGPGSMAQGHKPDEFVSADQLAACDVMLDALLERLRGGL
ncbi:MAG: acetylornithine deacetylase [Pseudomonadota bacterium]